MNFIFDPWFLCLVSLFAGIGALWVSVLITNVILDILERKGIVK